MGGSADVTASGEIVATLEAVLKMAPRSPGANHYYIHVVEASLHPEEGLEAADRLGMYVEVEAPFCWVGGTLDSPTNLVRTLTPTSAMVTVTSCPWTTGRRARSRP